MMGELNKTNILIVLHIMYACKTVSSSIIQKRQTPELNGTKFLMNYGYLYITEQHIQDDIGSQPPGLELSKNEQIRRAVLNFQQYHGLTETGEFDEATIELMGRPRCGDPDVYDNYRPAKFVVTTGAIWEKNVLTFDVLEYSNHMTRSEVDNEIERAFATWSDVTNLRFQRTNSEDADIRIRFKRGDHGDGIDNAFDGTGGTLAHAYYPVNGALHFDEDELWTTNVGN